MSDESLLREAMAALEPWAMFADKAEAFVRDRAVSGGSPIMPTRDFRLADFARAHDAYVRLAARLGANDDRRGER